MFEKHYFGNLKMLQIEYLEKFGKGGGTTNIEGASNLFGNLRCFGNLGSISSKKQEMFIESLNL